MDGIQSGILTSKFGFYYLLHDIIFVLCVVVARIYIHRLLEITEIPIALGNHAILCTEICISIIEWIKRKLISKLGYRLVMYRNVLLLDSSIYTSIWTFCN